MANQEKTLFKGKCISVSMGLCKFQSNDSIIMAQTDSFPSGIPIIKGSSYQFNCIISEYKIATEIENFQRIG